MKITDKKLQQRLANDYVMNVMCTAARNRFKRLMQEDALLANTVQNTERYWQQLALLAPEKTPPTKVWNAIEKQLFRQQNHHVNQMTDNRIKNWFTSGTLLLKGWALAATVTSVLLGGYMALQVNQSTPSVNANYVAVIESGEHKAGWLAQVTDKSIELTALNAPAIGKDKSYELWLVADGLAAPKSLGLIAATGQQKVALSAAEIGHLAQDAKLAVSVEPYGGSPTGQPTSAPTHLGVLIHQQIS